MRYLAFFVAVVVASAAPAWAHPPGAGGHFDDEFERPVAVQPRAAFDGAAAATKARSVVETMIARNIVDTSWRGVPVTSTELQTQTAGKRWVVKFRNERVADRARQTLYVMFSEDGAYLAANHTGT